MLDFHLDVEGGNTGKSDRDHVFLLLLLQTVFKSLAWLGESCGRLRVHTLLDCQGVEMLICVVEIICQSREFVSVVASLGRVHGNSSLRQGGIEPS